ncbi:phosphoglycerate kinase [Moorella naiadis]|uniref:phosphoglycerate kinase n=1 Tax=Moorella naiadis (nom. illeg.) TaxID=3093670 RepID=UPI003D9C9834
MKYGIYTLDDFDFFNKTVLCRIDINSPLKPDKSGLRDITRIKGCLPTIKELAAKGAKVVILAHQGGDLEYKNFGSTAPHARVIGELLGRPVEFIDDVCGPAAREKIKNLKPGDILVLDNVRYMGEELTLFENRLKLNPEEQSQTILVRKLAPLADIYVCDAFAAAHRSQPTLVGMEEVLPSAMGRLFEEELSVLSTLRENPARPCYFILGGAKIEDAFIMMTSVLKDGVADGILTGGLVANIMFLAAGIDLGQQSKAFIYKHNLAEYIPVAGELLASYHDKMYLPEDLAWVADNGRQEVAVTSLPVEGLLVDIGTRTVASYLEKINAAGSIFINGPMGVFENEPSAYGTRAIWQGVAAAPAFSVIGGGDSLTAGNKFGVLDKFSYVCTAGGGLVRFLTGEELPVVKALRKAAQKFPPPGKQGD